MSFRKKNTEQRRWQIWVEKHRDTFARISLPDFIYFDEKAWFNFLEHDGWYPEPAWSVRMLAPEEAAMFARFIISEYGTENYRFLLKRLLEINQCPNLPTDHQATTSKTPAPNE